MPILFGCRRNWAASFVFTIIQFGAASDPALSVVAGRTGTTPFGPAEMDFGWRGLAYSTSLHTGELNLPLELGISLRTAVMRLSGWFEQDRFTDIQAPVLFHGRLGWRRLEWLALWIPSYTLEMSQISSSAGRISDTQSLRTRFNMGLGSGLQLDLPLGTRLRGQWVYNLFAPYPASRLTWGELEGSIAVPLLFRKPSE